MSKLKNEKLFNQLETVFLEIPKKERKEWIQKEIYKLNKLIEIPKKEEEDTPLPFYRGQVFELIRLAFKYNIIDLKNKKLYN